MDPELNYPELVRQARLGNQESIALLVRVAEQRLLPYIYRLTLNYEVAQELLQETLLEMLESLRRIKHPGRFWSWLFRTALGKVQHYFRDKQGVRTTLVSAQEKERLRQNTEAPNDGLTELIRKELSEATLESMATLKVSYRNVLVLRCFEQMPYSEIAIIMGCRECQARALFFRAKRTLKRRLSHRGFGKGIVLMALTLFGRMTAPAKAAPASTSVTAATTKVGLTGTIIGAAGTKLGITVATAITAAALTIGAIAATRGQKLPDRSRVKSLYFVKQVRSSNPGLSGSLTAGAYELWYYFPEGPDGPVLTRIQRWDPSQRRKRCSWLQNGQANYYHYAGRKTPPKPQTIYINNYNGSSNSLRTRRLPTDPPDFVEFLDEVEGKVTAVHNTRDHKTGLLTSVLDTRFPDVGEFRSKVAYNAVDETFFRSDWPEAVPVVDRRDAMHKRGWTYFRITGQIDGEQVQGWGRMPFVYNAGKQHPAWLRLRMGDRLEIVDSLSGAYLAGLDGKVIATYPSGSFFRGLARPWMGMHAIDIVRRDAADSRIEFDTQETEDKKVQVNLLEQAGYRHTGITYVIDMKKDVIERMEFLAQGDDHPENQGQITFTYLDHVEQVADEFIEPAPTAVSSETHRQPMGILWLMELAQGTLGQ
jgi:RNA polymerase sigma-70 factor (ECF subfamily)